MTFPRTVGHIPTSTHQRPTGRPINRRGRPGSGRYLDALVFPRLPFGYGLTYTTFEYGELTVSRRRPLASRRGSVRVSVDVTNTGTAPAREVVQLYLRDHVAAVTRPIVELADWHAVDARPGATTTVTFRVTAEHVRVLRRDMAARIDTGEVDVIVGPNAAHGSRARLLTVTRLEEPRDRDPRHRRILIDGEPRVVMAGEIHYFRVARDEWEHRILAVKEAGCTAVASYIPWLWHELPDGTIDVTGRTQPERDVAAFIDLCARPRAVVRRQTRAVHHGRAEERGPALPALRRASRDRPDRLGRASRPDADRRLPRAGLPRRVRPLVRRDPPAPRCSGCSRSAAT